jgi:hypothetical protein
MFGVVATHAFRLPHNRTAQCNRTHQPAPHVVQGGTRITCQLPKLMTRQQCTFTAKRRKHIVMSWHSNRHAASMRPQAATGCALQYIRPCTHGLLASRFMSHHARPAMYGLATPAAIPPSNTMLSCQNLLYVLALQSHQLRAGRLLAGHNRGAPGKVAHARASRSSCGTKGLLAACSLTSGNLVEACCSCDGARLLPHLLMCTRGQHNGQHSRQTCNLHSAV